MRRIVIDTSALIDGTDEKYPEWTATIATLKGEHPFQAPALIASEVANVVHYKYPARYGETVAERAARLEVLLTGIEMVSSDPASREKCAELVAEHRLTFYDAEYLELASRTEDGFLLTHDQVLKKAGRALIHERCMDLDEAGKAIDEERL